MILAFFIHITAQGKLPKYMGFLVGQVKTASVQGPGNIGAASSSAIFPTLGIGVMPIVKNYFGVKE
jgi:hypothetical protein